MFRLTSILRRLWMRRSRESWPLVGSCWLPARSTSRHFISPSCFDRSPGQPAEPAGVTSDRSDDDSAGREIGACRQSPSCLCSSGWLSLVHVITLLPVLLPPALTWIQRRERTARPNLVTHQNDLHDRRTSPRRETLVTRYFAMKAY